MSWIQISIPWKYASCPLAFSPACGGTVSVAPPKNFNGWYRMCRRCKIHLFCFASLTKIHTALQVRWIVLDSLTVLAANLLHYYICWSNKYKTLVLVRFSRCSRCFSADLLYPLSWLTNPCSAASESLLGHTEFFIPFMAESRRLSQKDWKNLLSYWQSEYSMLG